MGGMGGGMSPEALDKMIPQELRSAPKCKPFTCEGDQVPVQAVDADLMIRHFGCNVSKLLKDVGLDEVNQYSMGMLKQPKLASCCEKVAACYATCGMTVGECFEQFNKCTSAASKNANMAFAPVKMVSGFLKDMPAQFSKGEDFAQARCKNYEAAQAKNCKCVAPADRQAEAEASVKALYERVGQASEVEGSPQSADSPYSQKIGPIRERWIKQGNEKEVFEKLLLKFSSKVMKVVNRPAINIGAIPGVAQMMKHPYVKMGISMAGVDLKDFGLDPADLEDDESEVEEEAVDEEL
jgi:hypothetical protein